MLCDSLYLDQDQHRNVHVLIGTGDTVVCMWSKRDWHPVAITAVPCGGERSETVRAGPLELGLVCLWKNLWKVSIEMNRGFVCPRGPGRWT